MQNLLDQLQMCPMFSGGNGVSFELFAQEQRIMSLESNEQLFEQGDPCDALFVVLSGCIRIYRVGPNQRQKTLHLCRPYQSFAEAAIFNDGPYPACAEAAEPSSVLRVPKDEFLYMLRKNPDVSLAVLGSLSKWMHVLLDQLESQSLLNARMRVNRFLVRTAQAASQNTGSLTIELQQRKKDLAQDLGLTPETLSRVFKELETSELIQVEGSKIHIIDLDVLASQCSA